MSSIKAKFFNTPMKIPIKPLIFPLNFYTYNLFATANKNGYIWLCSHPTEQLFVSTRKAIQYTMNSNGKEEEQVIHRHWTLCQSGWPKWLLFSKSQLFTLAQWISVLFPSYSLTLPSRHLFILHHSLAQNLSNMWWAPWPLFRMVSCSFTQFTTEIVGQTQHYVWKEALSGMIFVLVQWLSSVASVNIALKGWLRVNVKG